MLKLSIWDPFHPESVAACREVWISWRAIGTVQREWAADGRGSIVQTVGDPEMLRVRESVEQVLEMREIARKREAS